MKLSLAARVIVPSLLVAVLSLAAPAAASPQTAPPPIAFVHVNLVPMDSERVLADQAVVVQGGLITALGPTADVTVPPEAQTIDGHGLWLLPGLIDSHMHLLEPDELSLYLANGVTTVRNMSGEPLHLWWRREIREGRMAGPTLETASPQFDSVPPEGTNRVIVKTREEAERAVDALATDYDLFKVYNGLTVEVYEGVADAARRHGARVVGHIPRAPGLDGVLAAGQASIDHAEEFLYTAFRNSGSEKIPEVVKAVHDAGTWVTPTLVTFDMIGRQIGDAASLDARPEQRFVDPAMRKQWLSQSNHYLRDFKPEDAQRFSEKMPFLRLLTRELHAGGVPLLAGTDAGIAFGVPYVLPGFSLHEELAELVACGLSPYEALRTATVNPGRFGRTDPITGIIATGARADLLLVHGDPLQDVAHVQEIAGVMVRGRWLPEAELDALLESLPRLYADEAAFVKVLRDDGVAAAAQRFAAAVAQDPHARLFRDSTLNALGYDLLQAGRTQDALAAFELNVRAYPGSADVHDSLGEARRAAGDKAGALASYERALAMNPWNTNAAAVLEELRAEH
jgi:imidazolonepropionase-like amidohydrolase